RAAAWNLREARRADMRREPRCAAFWRFGRIARMGSAIHEKRRSFDLTNGHSLTGPKLRGLRIGDTILRRVDVRHARVGCSSPKCAVGRRDLHVEKVEHAAAILSVAATRAAVPAVHWIVLVIRECPREGRIGIERVYRHDHVNVPWPRRVAEVLRLAAGE